MPPIKPFSIKFAPEVVEHLYRIDKKYHRLIRKTIRDKLTYTPGKETRNRKLLDQPSPHNATWELRFGPDNRFRVFYEIDNEHQEVWILAIGRKEGNRLFIGGEEYSK